MLVLGIESTCDETAAALVADGWDVRSNVVATQVELHAKYRGVVPEIASRAHIENILPVLGEAVGLKVERVAPASSSILPPSSLDAVAVAYRPGLVGSLLVGVTAAKTLAWALGKPLIGPIMEKRILDEVGRRLIPDIHDRIVTKFSYAPSDFASDLNAHLGSAFSLEPILTQSAYFRVHNRDPNIPNLYFVGAGTHPGAGIPGVVGSAKATAALMLSGERA